MPWIEVMALTPIDMGRLTLAYVWDKIIPSEKAYILEHLNRRRLRKGLPLLTMATLPFTTVEEAGEVGFTHYTTTYLPDINE